MRLPQRLICLAAYLTSGGLLIAGVLFLALAPVPATGGEEGAVGSATQRIITSDKPADRGPFSGLLRRLLGGTKSEKLAHTQSEVWTVPQTRMGHLKQRLRSLGVKFTVLQESWNHILRRDKTVLSRVQENAIASARQEEMLGVTVMRASEAAVGTNQQITVVRNTAVRTDKGVL